MTWTHQSINGEERAVHESVIRNEGRTLYFKELTHEDAGEYECMATNELGQHRVTIVLNIGELDNVSIVYPLFVHYINRFL